MQRPDCVRTANLSVVLIISSPRHQLVVLGHDPTSISNNQNGSTRLRHYKTACQPPFTSSEFNSETVGTKYGRGANAVSNSLKQVSENTHDGIVKDKFTCKQVHTEWSIIVLVDRLISSMISIVTSIPPVVTFCIKLASNML